MLRMKIKSYILVILFSLSFAACEKEDNNGPKTDNDVNLWIERIMRENYLWYSELPEKNKLNFDAEPEDFLLSLLSDKDGKDLPEGHHYYSTLEKAVATKSIFNDRDSYGFDFATSNLKSGNNIYKIAVVLYVLKNSPAEEAGLKRGDWILGVNGAEGTIQNYDILRSGGSVSLQLARYDEDREVIIPTREIALGASRVVEDTPFLKDSVYTIGNSCIGYLMYNHFTIGPDGRDDMSYNLYLQQLFEKFKSRNVNEFVLDLRYNGGGDVRCAQLLASLLAPESVLGDTFCKLEYNDKNESKNNVIPLLKTSEVRSGNLNLKRLFVLTGSNTASSSELVINSLKPYLGNNVRLIGVQTFGKTVGMSVYDESEKYGWIFSPVTFRSYNKEGKADYADGFSPDIRINEFNWNLVNFGETNEPLLAEAIYEITGRSSLKSVRSASKPVPLDISYSPQQSIRNNMVLYIK